MTTATPPSPINHYENFPVASWLCPKKLRAPISAIYHFARTADDIADEGTATSAQRLHNLGQMRKQLELAVHYGAEGATFALQWQSVFSRLQQAMTTHHMNPALLHALLDAFVQDVEYTRDATAYATDEQLLLYCSKSANPVGRMLLHLYGVDDPLALQQSDAICTALQLANFWQDPSVDLPRGRCYFTDTMLASAGVSRAMLLRREHTPATTYLVQQCVLAAQRRMMQGAPLVHHIPGRAGWELRLVVQGGLRILRKTYQLGGAALTVRPRLRSWDYVVMLWRACWM